jgi:hypothetical protein
LCGPEYFGAAASAHRVTRPLRPSATSHPTALPEKPDARALLSESQAYHTPCRAKNQQKIKRDPRKRKIGIQKKKEIQ